LNPGGVHEPGLPDEDELDALLDLPPQQRPAALARIRNESPERADLLARWLGAVDASEGFLEHDTPRDIPNRIGQRIGRWRIVGRLGEGGSGDVFLVDRDDRAYEQKGALKLLRPGQSIEEWQIAHERQLLARLDHPNIARLLDGGVSADGRSFLVTEHIEGRSLSAWLDGNRPSIEQRVRVLIAIAEAVSSAHARLVVHGDLKPANLLVDGDHRMRLIDFGVSRLMGQAIASPEHPQALTPAWAAPEQLSGNAATPQSDQYTLGLLLYYLLIGHLPAARDEASVALLIAAARMQPALRPSDDPRAGSNAAACRGDLDAIVFRCLQPDPAQRYRDVRSLIVDLDAWLNHHPVAARPWTRGYLLSRFVRRHRMATLLITALLIAVVVLALDNARLRSG